MNNGQNVDLWWEKGFYFCMSTSLVSNLNAEIQFEHFGLRVKLFLLHQIIQMVGSTIRNVYGM